MQEGIMIPQRENGGGGVSFWVSSFYLGLMMQFIGTNCSVETTKLTWSHCIIVK